MPVTISGNGQLSGIPRSVIQVTHSVYTTQVAVASTTYTSTGLSGSITPVYSSSKILVTINLQTYLQIQSNVDQGAAIRILRNGTQIAEQPRLAVVRAGTGASGFVLIEGVYPFTYLDSPGTTSALTYAIDIKAFLTSPAGQVVVQQGGAPSTMTLTEIAA